MDRDQLRRVMRDLGDAINAYQQGQGFGGIEKLASEIEQLRSASYGRHAQEIRNALKRETSRGHTQRVDPRLGTT
jgi:hypothetical protein